MTALHVGQSTFNIVIGTNERMTTAGHCGYSGSNNWYNRVIGKIGSELASLYEAEGQDIMYVSMADAQASQYIYACCSSPWSCWDWSRRLLLGPIARR